MSRRTRGRGVVDAVRASLLPVILAVGAACSAAPPPSGPATSPSTASSPSMAPSAEPSLSEDPLPSPPGATLRRADTDGPAVAGGLGSWSLDGMASDAPWLPADVLETVDVPLGARLAVTFADGAAIGTWTAVLADVADRDGAVARTVAQGDGSGGSAVEVEAPPPGEWVLAVTLTRADGRGRATYSWAVSVR